MAQFERIQRTRDEVIKDIGELKLLIEQAESSNDHSEDMQIAKQHFRTLLAYREQQLREFD